MPDRRNILFIIAIDHYLHPHFSKLSNPVADAKAFTSLLVDRYGFEVFPDPLYNEQATKENVYQGFNSLLLNLSDDDNLVIYYAGHGEIHRIGRQGYWVPYDAQNRISDFIENSTVKDFVERIPSKHKFLIVDSCFSGTFLSQTRASGSSDLYSGLDSRQSRWVLASGGEEKVSDGKAGEHSPFARSLIRFLSINDNKYASTKELIRYVTTVVGQTSGQKTQGAPFDNIGHDGGQMVFVLKEKFVRSEKLTSRGLPNTFSLSEEIRKIEPVKERLPAGKDILFIKSFIDPSENMVVELFRFDAFGKKKHRYEDGVLRMVDKEGNQVEWTVIRRFATWQGFDRFMDENANHHKGRKIVILRAHESIEEVEETEFAIEHADLLEEMMANNSEITRCLHCGRVISSAESVTVEIDEHGLQAAAGNVHATCIRPLDRIIGRTMIPHAIKNLDSFDYNQWLDLLPRGQFFWRSALQASANRQIWGLAWNPEHIVNTGDYCIRVKLSNGVNKYLRLGREIQRFSESEVDRDLKMFASELEMQKMKGDPLGYTSKQWVHGSISELKLLKLADEDIHLIEDMEKVKYSRQIESENNTMDYDYAPVGLIQISGSSRLVKFGNIVPLIFDPSLVESLQENWQIAGFDTGPFAIKTLANDHEFDLALHNLFEQGAQPVVHPTFDDAGKLIGGAVIEDMRKYIVDNRKTDGDEGDEFAQYSYKSNPSWRKDDEVSINLPGSTEGKKPHGLLLSDEFVDEEGESCVIFCPLVEGKKKTQWAVKVPVKLLGRV